MREGTVRDEPCNGFGVIELGKRKKLKIKLMSLLISCFLHASLLTMLIVGSTPLQHQRATLRLLLRPREGGLTEPGSKSNTTTNL